MDFTLSSEQQMLLDSIEKFVDKDYDFATRRRLANSDLGYDQHHWQTFAELGWLSVPFAENHGGFGGGPIDVMIMLEAFGKALVAEPYIACVILGGRLLETLGNSAHHAKYLTPLIAGDLQLALAHTEAAAGSNPAYVGTRMVREGDDYLLKGEKLMVLNGHAADHLLVTARSGGADRDPAGIEVFVIDAASPGVSRRCYPTIDGLRAADIRLDDVRATPQQRLGDPASNFDALEKILDEAIVAMGAEAVGAMEYLYKATVEYTRTREQFGTPIGKFQALQHRMVDMFMAHEQSKSLLYMAALHNLEGGVTAKRAACALKVQVGKAGRLVAQEAVQLHGGMGMTDELNIGYYFKRLTAIDALLGSRDYHLDRYARLSQLATSASSEPETDCPPKRGQRSVVS